MHTVLKTGPIGTIIDLDEAKLHLRVDHTSDDTLIQGLIWTAIDQAETITRRRLLTQTWTAYFDGWPAGDYIQLPYGQLQSVTSVKYKDSDATESTMDSDEYIVDTYSEPGRVVLDYGESWPSETLYPSNPVYIEFVCGYGTVASDVPMPIRSAILLILEDYYDNRGGIVVGASVGEIPGHIMNLLWPYRLWIWQP
jgi:uncharacterized phiE125 gp8 family phage protein